MNNLTIFTDASFCPDTGAAGGAFWSRSEDRFLKDSFPLDQTASSQEAELQTAIQAIRACLNHRNYDELIFAKGKVLIILVTDCMFVKDILEGRTKKSPLLPHVESLHSDLWNLRISLKVNHVKGHSGKDSPRTWVNNWCDREAGKHMRQQRTVLKRVSV